MDVTFRALVSNGQTDLQMERMGGRTNGHKYRHCGALVDPILFQTNKNDDIRYGKVFTLQRSRIRKNIDFNCSLKKESQSAIFVYWRTTNDFQFIMIFKEFLWQLSHRNTTSYKSIWLPG